MTNNRDWRLDEQQLNQNQRLESFELFHAYMAGRFTGAALLSVFKDMLRRYDKQKRALEGSKEISF